jgi:hypothetical protein
MEHTIHQQLALIKSKNKEAIRQQLALIKSKNKEAHGTKHMQMTLLKTATKLFLRSHMFQQQQKLHGAPVNNIMLLQLTKHLKFPTVA